MKLTDSLRLNSRSRNARNPSPTIDVSLSNAVPQRVEVGSAVRSAERDGKCLIRGVIINRCTGPQPVAADEVLASAEVGGPVTVDGERFVEAAGHHRGGAAEAVRQEIFPEQIVVVDPAVEFGARSQPTASTAAPIRSPNMRPLPPWR